MNKNKKILFVSHEYSVNGSTLSLLSLIKGIEERYKSNIDIIVITPWKSCGVTRADELFISHDIKCKQILYRGNFKIAGKNTFVKYIHDIWNFFAVGILCQYIKRNKVNIVCSNSSAVDVGARAALMAGIPHIYYVREFMEEDFGFEYRNKRRMKKLLESSENIIFISKAIEKKYISLYHLKNTTQFFDGIIAQDYYVKNHSILQKKEISFVQVGNFGDGKGVLNTIDLLYRTKQKNIVNWSMEFVGSGSEVYIAEMRERIAKYHLEEKIKISDFCTKIKDKLAVKDILIMNSGSEGFGRVTVEGMLAGCLIIGRNAGGTIEILTNGINGILFKDENEFLDAVKDIEKNREKYKEMAKKGQTYALEGFQCVKTARNFIEVVEECLQHKDVFDENR